MLLVQTEDATQLFGSTAPVLLVQTEDVVGCQCSGVHLSELKMC